MATNAASRATVVQDGEFRPCDELRHIQENPRKAILTPLTLLPTWGRRSEIAMAVFLLTSLGPLLRGGLASAYKQRPLDPAQANLSVISLLRPETGQWVDFVPKAILFGSVSASLHYNCFSRCLDFLINRRLGAPVLRYF